MFSRRRLGLRKRWALNIFSDLYTTTVAEHRLNTLFWECTLRCNLACRHCGSDCRVNPQVPDMPLADFLKVLDDQITPHVDPTEVLIIFSGGEVLVREDLEQAVWRARNVAAPQNTARKGYRTPCAVKGDKCYDCQSPDRICNALVIHLHCLKRAEAEIVLIDEKLGF